MNLQQDYPCPYCSSGFSKIYHGGRCPQVESIEYYADGTVKKVRFFDPRKNNPIPLDGGNYGVDNPGFVD